MLKTIIKTSKNSVSYLKILENLELVPVHSVLSKEFNTADF